MYLQIATTFAVTDEFIPERGYRFGFILAMVETGKTESGDSGMRVVSNTFSGVARLHVEFTRRANIAARMLLSGLLYRLANGPRLP